jgi:hypothetical protein
MHTPATAEWVLMGVIGIGFIRSRMPGDGFLRVCGATTPCFGLGGLGLALDERSNVGGDLLAGGPSG